MNKISITTPPQRRDDIVKVGNLFYDTYRAGFAGNVCGINGICPCVTAVAGGYREPIVLIEYKE